MNIGKDTCLVFIARMILTIPISLQILIFVTSEFTTPKYESLFSKLKQSTSVALCFLGLSFYNSKNFVYLPFSMKYNFYVLLWLQTKRKIMWSFLTNHARGFLWRRLNS